MKINTILVVVTLLETFSSNAQIDQGNRMMVGGSTFSSYNYKFGYTTSVSKGF